MIYLMRHAQSAPTLSVGDDPCLSRRGELEAYSVAFQLGQTNPGVTAILHSPLRRASETARICGKVLQVKQVQSSPLLLPDASLHHFMQILMEGCNIGGLLLIGHNPRLLQGLNLLTSGDVEGVSGEYFLEASIIAVRYEQCLLLSEADYGNFRVDGHIRPVDIPRQLVAEMNTADCH